MALYRRQAKLLEAEVATDIVALDPALGKCFGFNEVAATVWRYLAEPRSFAEIEAHLLSEFDVQPEQCASELQELLFDMAAKRLITQREPSGIEPDLSTTQGGKAVIADSH